MEETDPLAALRAAADRLHAAACGDPVPFPDLEESIDPSDRARKWGAAVLAAYGRPGGRRPSLWSLLEWTTVGGGIRTGADLVGRPPRGFEEPGPIAAVARGDVPVDALGLAHRSAYVRAMAFAGWVRNRIDEIEESAVPAIRLISEAGRGRVAVEVRVAGSKSRREVTGRAWDL